MSTRLSTVSIADAGYTKKASGALLGEKMYRVTANVSGSYETDYSYTQPKDVTVSWNSSSWSIYYSKTLHKSIQVIGSCREWTITPKTTSNNNSTGNNNVNNNNSTKFNQLTQQAQNSAGATGTTTPAQNWTPSISNTTNNTTVDINQQVGKKNLNISDDSKRLYIRALYKRTHKREPNNEEIEHHFPKTVQQLSVDIILSKRSKETNNIDGMSNAEFIKAVYKYIFGRTDSNIRQDEIDYWLDKMNKGLTREGVVKANSESAEFEFQRITSDKAVTIQLNEKLCGAIYSYLINNTGMEVIRKTSTTLTMYSNQLNQHQTIDISGKSIDDLTGISNFQNLKILIAQNNALNSSTDFSELKKLTKLTKLNLNNNNLGGNYPYLELTNLEELSLDNTGLKEQGADFSALTKLKILSLKNNKLTQLSGVSKLTNLKELYIDNNEISSIADFDNLKLDKFTAKNNVLADNGIASEKELPKIFKEAKTQNSKVYTQNDIKCTDCSISNGKVVLNNNAKKAQLTIDGGAADGTTYVYNDERLTLSFADKVLVDKLVSLLGNDILSRSSTGRDIVMSKAKVESISTLDLSADEDSEKITSISGLEAFTNLTSLNLNNNKVTNLRPLQKLTKLKTLSIRANGLNSIAGINVATSLEQLDVSNNRLEAISDIQYLKNLQALILANNIIKNNLQPISKLSNLNVLDISNNSTSDIKGIGNNIKLSALFASKNNISDISILNRENLQTIDFRDNTIDIKYSPDQDSIEMPNILKCAIEADGIENIQCFNKWGVNHFSIENSKIIPDEQKLSGEIRVKDGDYAGTIINIQNTYHINEPNIEVKYDLSEDKSQMTVTLHSDIPLQYNFWGWEKADNNTWPFTYKAVYDYNIRNQKLYVKSQYGVSTEVTIDFDSIVNPRFVVNYSNPDKSTGNVEVTVSSPTTDINLPQDLIKQGWAYGGNNKIIKRTFTENEGTGLLIGPENIPYYSVKINVMNIDKQEPELNVSYSETENTTRSVIANVAALEKFDINRSICKSR